MGEGMKSGNRRAARRAALALGLAAAFVLAPSGSARGQGAPTATMKAGGAAPARPYTPRPSAEAIRWADAELKRMSLEEKVGQLIAVGINGRFLHRESAEYRELRRQVERLHVGGIILFRAPVYESAHIVNRMQQHARRPLLISADLESGLGMRFEDTTHFPWNMAVGATGEPELARRQGEVTAREARAVGVQQLYAPVVDVNNNAANPVINVRSYGEDPWEVARFAAAFIRGAQGAGVIATAKHFPGHGDTSVDSHRGLPVIDAGRERLEATELVPFRAAVAAGVGAVMSAHIGLPRIDPSQARPLRRQEAIRPAYVEEGGEIVAESAYVPATLSPAVIGGMLRGSLGFDGLVVTDAMDMSGLTIYFKQDEAAVRAVLAGVDMLVKPADPEAAARGLREAVRSGRLAEKRVEESARKILAAKYDLGLVRSRLVQLDEIDRLVSAPEALKLADEIAARALTLVRDDARQLRAGEGLRPGARLFNLAVTNGEDRLHVANTFAAQMARLGRPVETVVLDARSTEAEAQRAVERAAGADLVIASLYVRVRSGATNSGAVPEAGARALNSLLERGAPVVGVSFGSPYLLRNFPRLKTYLVTYGDMPSLQAAAARALAGRADITGRLPITLPGLYPRGTGIQLKAPGAAAGAVNRK